MSETFVAPQGAYFLRRFADDLARVQLMGGGSVKTVTFEGPGAEARALEYQAWANEKLAATVCPTKDEQKEPPAWGEVPRDPFEFRDIRTRVVRCDVCKAMPCVCKQEEFTEYARSAKAALVALVNELENIGLFPVIGSKRDMTVAKLADEAIKSIVQHAGHLVCVCRKCRNSPCTCGQRKDGL